MLVFINYWIEKCTVKHWKKIFLICKILLLWVKQWTDKCFEVEDQSVVPSAAVCALFMIKCINWAHIRVESTDLWQLKVVSRHFGAIEISGFCWRPFSRTANTSSTIWCKTEGVWWEFHNLYSSQVLEIPHSVLFRSSRENVNNSLHMPSRVIPCLCVPWLIKI